MKPSSRHRVNKNSSARKFRADSRRTAGPNIWSGPMRGGIRL